MNIDVITNGKLLVLFTSCYPNDSGEVFVENEIRILEKYFERIIIICSKEQKKEIDRYIPKNAEVNVFKDNLSFTQKLRGIPFLFKMIFWHEIHFAKKNFQISFKFLHYKILYIDLIKGYLLSKFVEKVSGRKSLASICYYSYWSDYKAIACAFLKKKNAESKAIARNHGWDIYFYANKPEYLPLRKFIFGQLDAIFCVSQHGVDYLTNELKFRNINFYISKLGTYNHNSHNKLQGNSDSLLLISCSNLVPIKRIELLIDALQLVSNIPVTWIHFGEGSLKESLLVRAKKLNVHNNLRFEFKGETSNDDIMAFYKKYQPDLFINVSKSEGLPVSIMEAMSYGIPVIATAVGGTPEIVKEGYNGFLLSANPTQEEIAETITTFYKLSINEKVRLRQNAYNTWFEEYNAENNYKAFAEKILSL